MFSNKLTVFALIAASAAAFSAPANAQYGADEDLIKQLFKMEMMDKNKDGMVSKKEFMAMVDKAYEMKAKSMSVKTGMMTEAQVQELVKSLFGPR